jgi:phosphatidylserine/phosphatidylglycerophosphate/cardiolipin synthase-like enzyme
MVAWIRSPRTRFVAVSYYAFGSPSVADALCEEATQRALKVEAILQDWPSPRGPGSSGYRKLVECAQTTPSLRVTKLGAEGGIHHAKIFLASESPDPFDQASPDTDARTVVTVSSANLSHNGVGMHLENWLIMEGPASEAVLRANWCYVQSLPHLAGARNDFHQAHLACQANARAVSGANASQNDAIQFIPMPATRPARKAIDALLETIASAQKSIHVAAHIFTAARTTRSGLVAELIAAARRGVDVTILLDDDTELVYRRLGPWQRLKVGSDDLEAVQMMLSSPVKLKSVDTNEQTSQLHHNKFIVIDGQTLWTGSGNFTASSLAGRNTEQFYLIRDTAIVQAYNELWNLIDLSATPFGTLQGENGLFSGNNLLSP